MDLSECQGFSGIRHPWEEARLNAAIGILRGTLERAAIRVLDVGGGDGFVARELSRRFSSARIVALDTGYAGGEGCGQFVGTNVRCIADLQEAGAERFDLMLLLDVVEHVDDDLELLRSCVSGHLAAGGRVLVFAPAFPILFGEHDRRLGHRRRYRVPALRALAAQAGLVVERCGYLFPSLLLLRAGSVLLERLGRSGTRPGVRQVARWRGGGVTTWLVRSIMMSENGTAMRLANAGIRVPGLTGWMLCRES